MSDPLRDPPAPVAPQPPLVWTRRRGPAVWLTLSRPEAANALSRDLVTELRRAIDEVHADASVRAVVVTGDGRTFCAGADLKERRGMSLDETRAFLDLLNDTLSCLAGLPCAGIAAINGGAL